jgi:hypothetical protein
MHGVCENVALSGKPTCVWEDEVYPHLGDWEGDGEKACCLCVKYVELPPKKIICRMCYPIVFKWQMAKSIITNHFYGTAQVSLVSN